jgi:GTPase SAR1 family protein
MDLNMSGSIAPTYREALNTYIASADGIILLYDIASKYSYERVTNEVYFNAWKCRDTVYRKDGPDGKMWRSKKRFGCVLVGNKKDLIDGQDGEAKREVNKYEAEEWAECQGFRGLEISSNERGEVEEAVKALVASVEKTKRQEARDDRDSREESKDRTQESVGASLWRAVTRSK